MSSSEQRTPIRVAIACRDANFGAALAAQSETIRVTAIFESLQGLAKAAENGTIDAIVAVDPAEYSPEDVLAVARDLPVLMLGPTHDAGPMIEAVEAGAFGYSDVDAPLESLIADIHSVANGAGVIPPLLLGSLLRHVVERQRLQRRARESLEVLSPRERQVFELSARGFDKEALAAELFISPATARTHVQNLFRKLGVHSVAELVALAAECGFEVASPRQRTTRD